MSQLNWDVTRRAHVRGQTFISRSILLVFKVQFCPVFSLLRCKDHLNSQYLYNFFGRIFVTLLVEVCKYDFSINFQVTINFPAF